MTTTRLAPLVLLLCSSLADAQSPTAAIPELFAPGVISGPANDGSPTFSPDGNTLYFTRSTATWGVIVESRRADGKWSEPTVAPFSGEWSDSSPGMAPNGSQIVFVSLRPKDWQTNPQSKAPRIAQLFSATRVGAGWSTPVQLPAAVNRGPSIWKPSVAADGTIYFVSIDDQGGKRLFASALVDRAYQMAQPLPFSDGTLGDVDPEIAPDGSFLVFCSSGRMKGNPRDHLFIVLRDKKGWGPVRAIRYAGDDHGDFSTDDEPHLGVDHRTLYFASDRGVHVDFPRSRAQAARDLQRLESWDNSNANVFTLPLAPWIKAS